MPKLNLSRPLRQVTGPPRASFLAATWIHGELAVAVPGSGSGQGLWNCSTSVPDLGSLAECLRSAVRETGFSGRTLRLAIAHPHLVQRRIEMPPIRGAMRTQFLQRQADQMIPSRGAMHWVCRPSHASPPGEAVLMTLMPRVLQDSLVATAQSAGLDLRLLTPFSDLLIDHAMANGDTSGGLRLLATLIGGRLEMVVVRNDGVPVVARTAGSERLDTGTRILQEVIRTVQFVQQSFPRVLEGIWWLGAGTPCPSECGGLLQTVPFRTIPGDFDAGYWARHLADHPGSAPTNLLTRDQKEATGRRIVDRFHRGLAAACLSAAAGFFLYAERSRGQEQQRSHRLQLELTELESRERSLAATNQALEAKREFLSMAGPGPKPPVPLWLLGALGAATPAEIRLTNVAIRCRDGGWDIQIAGQTHSHGLSPVRPLDQLTTNLSAEPFRITWDAVSDPKAGPVKSIHWKSQLQDRRDFQDSTPKSFSLGGRIP